LSARRRLADLEKKKKSGWTGTYFSDDRDEARYNYLQDVVAQYESAGSSGGGGGGGGGGSMTLKGVLTLNGLSEAVLRANGQRMEDTPDNGPPVDMAPSTSANHK
jgi:hypothetical protein